MSIHPRRLCLLVLLGCAAPALRAADPVKDTSHGEQVLDAYLRAQTRRIADACLADVKSKADWEAKRPELRRQFLEMMGLWPLPERTELKATVTGKVVTERYTVEKLHFQSLPGLYVTANLYVPKLTTFPAPAVLYVCGHANTVVDGVSYGSKVNYQHHPAWFAEHGYVCLILDTLQLGEIPGLHHGLHHLNLWWWQTLGYTPAGIECWNAMRALDYLETRREVDPKRIGVTGRSGGGATSWWLAAADGRPQCIVPVAGIGDLWAHVVEGVAPRYQKGVITGHCDCMYFTNTYRWDFPMVAALCAPRPLLLGNSDADEIFPVPGYRRLAEKVRRVYDLYGAGDHFTLLETGGPHKDTPELRRGAFAWMNRWLRNGAGDTEDPERPRLSPQQLKVFDRPPGDAINPTVHETFLKPANPELPQAPEVVKAWWPAQRERWLEGLRTKVFRGWPEKPSELGDRRSQDVRHDGVRLQAFDFTSEEAMPLRLWLLTAEKVDSPSIVVLDVLDEPGWDEWVRDLGPAFAEALQVRQAPPRNDEKFAQNRQAMEHHHWAFAVVAPRGVGPTRWSQAGTPADIHIRRRFGLLGQTLDGQRVWDVRRAVSVLARRPELGGVPIWLQGKGDLAGVALYAGIFEPTVARVDLWHPPASHHEGPIFLNVRRVLDMPQAVALALPKPVHIYVKDERAERNWDWPAQLDRSLGLGRLKIRRVGD